MILFLGLKLVIKSRVLHELKASSMFRSCFVKLKAEAPKLKFLFLSDVEC